MASHIDLQNLSFPQAVVRKALYLLSNVGSGEEPDGQSRQIDPLADPGTGRQFAYRSWLASQHLGDFACP